MSYAANRLRRAIHTPSAANVASEAVTAGDTAAPATARATLRECGASKARAQGSRPVI